MWRNSPRCEHLAVAESFEGVGKRRNVLFICCWHHGRREPSGNKTGQSDSSIFLMLEVVQAHRKSPCRWFAGVGSTLGIGGDVVIGEGIGSPEGFLIRIWI